MDGGEYGLMLIPQVRYGVPVSDQGDGNVRGVIPNGGGQIKGCVPVAHIAPAQEQYTAGSIHALLAEYARRSCDDVKGSLECSGDLKACRLVRVVRRYKPACQYD